MKKILSMLALTLALVMAVSFASFAKTSRSTMENQIKSCFSNWGKQGKGWDFTKSDGVYMITIYDDEIYNGFVADALYNDATTHLLVNEAAGLIDQISLNCYQIVKKAGFKEHVAVGIGKNKDHIVYCACDGKKFYDARYDD